MARPPTGDDGAAPTADPAPPPGTLRRELAAFCWALRGVQAALRSERHLRFHALATAAVVTLGIAVPLSAAERSLVLLAIGLVWVAELVNTAVERLVDQVSPGWHPVAGQVKDVAAGAVLVAAVTAAGVGLIVLGPPVVTWLAAR